MKLQKRAAGFGSLKATSNRLTKGALKKRLPSLLVITVEKLVSGGMITYRVMNKRKVPLLAFSWLLLASVCFGATDNPRQTRFPFRVSEGGLILIQVTANGVKGEFILDTGAGIHVFSNGFLHKLSPQAAGHYTGFRNTGERIDFDLFQIASLSIGRFRQEHPVVAAWEVLDKFKIDGVLAAKFFEHHIVSLDFNKHELVFENRQTLNRRLRQGRVIPLKVLEDRDKTLGLFVDLTVGDSLTCECELDTGFDGLLILDARFMRPLNLDEHSATVKRMESKGLTGLTEIRYRATVSNVSLLGAPEVNVEKPEVTFIGGLIYDGVVGAGFWLNREVTLDIPSRRLIVGIK
jgi:predicted aspartyl protease